MRQHGRHSPAISWKICDVLCSLLLWAVYGFWSKTPLVIEMSEVWAIYQHRTKKPVCWTVSKLTDQDQRSKQPIFNHWPLTNLQGVWAGFRGEVLPHVACAWEKWSVWQNDHGCRQRHLNKWANLTWKADEWPKSQCKICQPEPWVSSGLLPRVERCSHHLEPPLLSIIVVSAEHKGSLVTAGQQTLIVLRVWP